jgi:hypothetical protein
MNRRSDGRLACQPHCKINIAKLAISNENQKLFFVDNFALLNFHFAMISQIAGKNKAKARGSRVISFEPIRGFANKDGRYS